MTKVERLRLIEFALTVQREAAHKGKSVHASDLDDFLGLCRKIHALSVRQSNSPRFGAGDANRRGLYVNKAHELGLLWGADVEHSFDPRGYPLTLVFTRDEGPMIRVSCVLG